MEIEKDIPIPADAIYHKNTIYPLQHMEPGDSFFLKTEEPRITGSKVLMRSYKLRQEKKLPETSQFVWAPVEGGIRVWRKS